MILHNIIYFRAFNVLGSFSSIWVKPSNASKK